ncbi:hypothetical protein PHYSODRAFT_294946 [Phytophthora sojae]|uniref:Uncharacterized protein n=1 Tax=Phytophthora sojae (strain P6497) TaxID=1094619 RepID=G4YN82_PHYSP|nr:hypothetical protein PHYSODRAFT_294946 [Phytophthora sojae]EGZ30035.1 hypothetical protein PHYSODRAFT_294946 [Phytophthora sojae]|eukprot:XP_009517310.1 hypothetical protein PHYSODRAFT_294946 [Phytophthora sojae]
MEGAATLGRAFEAVADALERTDGGASCVAVWPATAEGFVGELQVVKRREWHKMLRVGLRLAPGEDMKEVYCFENDMEQGGLMVRVMGLLRESQTIRRGDLQVWKVLKTPVVIRRRLDVLAEIERAERAVLGSDVSSTSNQSAVTTTPNGISSEGVQRKRPREVETTDLVPGSTTDEVRPPTKTRRLSVKESKKHQVVVAPEIASGSHDQSAGGVISEENSERSARYRSSCEANGALAGFVAVADVDSSSDLSCGELADDSSAATSDGGHSDVDAVEQDPPRSTRREIESDSGSSVDNEQAKVYSVLKHIAAAGLGADDDNFDGDQVGSRTSPTLEAAAYLSTSIGESLKPVWSVLQSATTRAQRALRGYCVMPSVLQAITADESLDYDLRWTEENDHQRWTMFGEPSSPTQVGVRTRHQQRIQSRTSPSWKFW